MYHSINYKIKNVSSQVRVLLGSGCQAIRPVLFADLDFGLRFLALFSKSFTNLKYLSINFEIKNEIWIQYFISKFYIGVPTAVPLLEKYSKKNNNPQSIAFKIADSDSSP